MTSLDGVRGVAALAVALPHYFLFQKTQDAALEFMSIVAVEVFFALSGFVLARQLALCAETGSLRNLRVFYIRRWMRTLPPYLIVLIFVSLISGTLFDSDFFQYALFIRNFGAIEDAGDYFPPAWSLAVEEWFYLIFPAFLAGLVWMRVSQRWAAGLFLLLLLAAKVVYVSLAPEEFEQARRIVVLRLDSIAYGFVLASFYWPRAAEWHQAAVPAGIGCATLLAVTILCWLNGAVFLFIIVAPLFATSLLALLLAFEAPLARARLAQPIISFGANTSYTIYLAHTPLILLMVPLRHALPAGLHFALYVAALLAICSLFFVTIEAPILRRRPRYDAAPGSGAVLSGLDRHGAMPTPARHPAMLIASNALVAAGILAAVEGGSWAIKRAYVQLRNLSAGVTGALPIAESKKTVDESGTLSTYSSAAVIRDLALRENLRGSPYRYEPYLVFQNKPFASSRVNVEESGMRLNGEPPSNSGDTRDVWLFGSSPVFGVTNADDETLAAQIGKALRRDDRTSVTRVMNFGVVGYTSWQDLLHFQMRLTQLPKPDSVIFFNGHNDHNLAWLSTTPACERLFETAVGSSIVLEQSWDIWSGGGFVLWPAVKARALSYFSNTLELARLTAKAFSLWWANHDAEGWRAAYRKRRDERAVVAESCIAKSRMIYLRNMRLAAELAKSEGIGIIFVHQPTLYTTAKPLVGIEKQELESAGLTAFALDDNALAELQTVPAHRLDQDTLWVKHLYTQSYDRQKRMLRALANEAGAAFIDVEPAINAAGAVAVFSSPIHFTFRGSALIGAAIAREMLGSTHNGSVE